MRKRKREVEDADGDYAGNVMTPGGQDGQLDMADLRIALAQLPDDQREAVVLVRELGLSYQEVAEICRVPVGTVKSRVNRARNKLATLLGNDPAFTGAFGERLAKTPPRKARAPGTAASQIGVWPCLTITGALAMSLGTILLIISHPDPHRRAAELGLQP